MDYAYGKDYNNSLKKSELKTSSPALCFVIDRKTDRTWCKPGVSVTFTATNFCPPNWDLRSDAGGWCNPPRLHFDMAQPAWEKIGIYRGGIIPVIYQRVPCVKKGGVRFAINSHDYFQLVLPINVAAAGSVKAMDIRATKPGADWMPMARNWGANWHLLAYLTGQGLSFRVTITDGLTIVFVIPPIVSDKEVPMEDDVEEV